MTAKRAAAGCLFGSAIGDALAAPTEFLSLDRIIKTYGRHGPAEPSARVTDDTQMMLAVGEALHRSSDSLTPTNLETSFRAAFVEWLDSPDNNRSPGITCMHACQRLAHGGPWTLATHPTSKGCGANMRVAPIGVAKLPTRELLDDELRAAIAQFQAALTHGHPTALAASDLTAAAIADLAIGGDPAGLLERLRTYSTSQRTVYHHNWLGTLWQRYGANSPKTFISEGWDECLAVLDNLGRAVRSPDHDADPCDATGEGWIAEEAFATGLLCFLLFPDDPVAAIRRAAVTRGDSDSIACLTGAFAGASLGLAAWPNNWVDRIEYHDRLLRISQAWDQFQKVLRIHLDIVSLQHYLSVCSTRRTE